MGRLARFAPRVLFGALLVAGWLALFLAIALYTAEKSGWLAHAVRDTLATQLGALGDELTIREARLRWFQGAIELEGIELGKNAESLRLDGARVEFAVLGALGPRVERVDARGGRLRFSRALVNGMQTYSTHVDAQKTFSARHAPPPIVRVEALDLELETARFGDLPLGRVDAFLRGDDRGEPELWGRMVPSLAANAADSGEIYLHGRVRDPGTFEVRATATRLPIGTDYLPAGSELDVVRPFEPRGFVDLDASGLFSLDGSLAPRARAQLSIQDGGLRVAAGKQRLDKLHLELSMRWTPPSLSAWNEIGAWNSEAKLSGEWERVPFDATAVLGAEAGPDLRAKAWLHVPRLLLSPALLDLIGDSPLAQKQWNAFGLHGDAEVWAGARVASNVAFGDKLSEKLDFALVSRLSGNTGLVYHGYPSSNGEYEGFPLPLEKINGTVVVGRDPRRLRPLKVGLVDLSGDHGSGLIHARGVIESHPVDVPPFAPGYGYAEIDLGLATEGLPVDDRLRKALAGLGGALPPAKTWEPFHPAGGKIDVDLRLVRTSDMRYLALDLGLLFDGVGLTWNDLPVPIGPTHANFVFRSDGKSERGLGFALDSTLRTAQRLRVVGRLQTDPVNPRPEDGKDLDEILTFAAQVDHVSLTGDDKKILVGRFPDIGASMDAMAPKGFVDVRYERNRPSIQGAAIKTAEVTPRDPVQLTPSQFQMITANVHGRVLVYSIDGGGLEPQTRVALAPLTGTWGQSVQVAFNAHFPENEIEVFGAGIDPSSKSLLGSLRQAIQSPGSEPVDVTAIQMQGQLDFSGTIRPTAEGDKSASDKPNGKKSRNSFRFFLRDSRLETTEGFRLDKIRGEIDLVDDTLSGDKLAALLAKTPVELRSTRFQFGTDGFRLETNFEATGVPIDKEHLGSFIDAETLDALVDELHWRGTLDVRGGHIVLSGPPQGKGRLEFSGQVIPRDMFVQMGLPISIRSASAKIERLIYEGGRVRAIVRIDDLRGFVADRELGPAKMLVTYIEPKLSIENLSGRLEGGELAPIGGEAGRHGTVFSIGLEEPFAFQLALGLKGVEVGGLVRGLFPSDIATRGRLDGELQLTGDMDHLLGITGSGSVRVVESRLWSIPVFRELFAQLGFDDTAVFDSMATNLRVRQGRVEMRDITVRSPLLQLVGKGDLDFDGALKYDLEVRYELIDRLGPFTRLLYAIQNQLLSVAIRGDMARPEIIFENPLSNLFRSDRRKARKLPLPAWASLPPRF
jgi:hypothetical protein